MSLSQSYWGTRSLCHGFGFWVVISCFILYPLVSCCHFSNSSLPVFPVLVPSCVPIVLVPSSVPSVFSLLCSQCFFPPVFPVFFPLPCSQCFFPPVFPVFFPSCFLSVSSLLCSQCFFPSRVPSVFSLLCSQCFFPPVFSVFLLSCVLSVSSLLCSQCWFHHVFLVLLPSLIFPSHLTHMSPISTSLFPLSLHLHHIPSLV